jgi:hypothetical protein
MQWSVIRVGAALSAVRVAAGAMRANDVFDADLIHDFQQLRAVLPRPPTRRAGTANAAGPVPRSRL